MVCVIQPEYLASETAFENLDARFGCSYAHGNPINLFRAGPPDSPFCQ